MIRKLIRLAHAVMCACGQPAAWTCPRCGADLCSECASVHDCCWSDR
jgi:hypothetical protein